MNPSEFRAWLEACTDTHVGWARSYRLCPLAVWSGRGVNVCALPAGSWERCFADAVDQESVRHITRERALEILDEVTGGERCA
jgi:hypothetical protein